MMKASPADRAQRGGVHSIYLREPLRSKLLAMKAKHKLSWSELLSALLANASKGGKPL